MKFLKFKVIVSVYLCLIVLAVYDTFHVYSVNRQDEKDKVFANLEIVAGLTALNIDGDKHQKITNTYLKKDAIKQTNTDKNYLEIHNVIKKIQVTSQIATPIYTLVKNGKNQLAFGVTSNQNPYYLHSYQTPPKTLLSKFNVGASLDEYKDENGTWLSSFSPIKTSGGQVVAIVQVDENFDEFLNEINKELIKNILFNVFIYSIVGILLFVFLNDVLKKEKNFNLTQLEYKKQLESEVKVRTKELIISNNQLKKVNNELESFFYSTSHDIRGPLSRILGLSHLAKIDEDYMQILDMIEIESYKMDDMLKKMIVVNNLRTKQIQIETVKTKNILEDVLSSINDNYKEKQVHIKLEYNNAVDFFNTDKEILKALFTNAIDNAFKFSDQDQPKVFINANIDKDHILKISIANNGKTFSDIEKQNAFDIFKRANKFGDTDTIRLGLYTIKNCTDKLNGIVQINDIKDGFTSLIIVIPDYIIAENFSTDINSLANY
jgi:signal transduction histidine kinase